jgi:uncharacterized membrane protein (Fun14 family)
MMTVKRILFRIWLIVSLIWLAFWGNVIGLNPDALVTLAQPKIYAAIIAPPLLLGVLCAAVVGIVAAVRRYAHRRKRIAPRP